MPAFDVHGRSGGLERQGEEPCSLTAERFPSVRPPSQYLRAGLDRHGELRRDDGPGPDAKVTLRRSGSKLGAERWGFQVTWATKKSDDDHEPFFVRQGRDVVGASASPRAAGRAVHPEVGRPHPARAKTAG